MFCVDHGSHRDEMFCLDHGSHDQNLSAFPSGVSWDTGIGLANKSNVNRDLC